MRCIVLLWLTLLAISPARADFSVESATPAIQIQADGDRELAINARLAFKLNAANEEALHNGIPLEVVIDLELVRQRWWWANKLITDWRMRRRISFHALSRQYLVSAYSPKQSAESFSSLDQALAHAGNLGNLAFVLPARKEIDPDARHLLRVRARLDIETLPTVMRPLAYTSPSWRLNSGWSAWPVKQ